MDRPDISLVLNAHREGVLLSYTLRSLVDTTLHAKSKGLTVELIAVLDCPDKATRMVLEDFKSEAFTRIEHVEVNNRSLGPSRNDGLCAARGAFSAIVDGDDIYSFNYLARLHETAMAGDLVVAVPSLCVWFDGDWMVLRFDHLASTGRFRLAGAHTFMSCILAPTAFLRDLGFRDCAGGRTFAFEDWDLNCRAVAAGADIRTAADAALFYRRHTRSIMAGLSGAQRIVLPSAFFDPEAFTNAGDGEGTVVEDGEPLRASLRTLQSSRTLAELVAHAGSIDPRIDIEKVRAAEVWCNSMFTRAFGATFFALCRAIGTARSSDVLVVEALPGAPDPIRLLATTLRHWLVIETAGKMASTAAPDGRGQIVALDALGVLPKERRAEMIVRLVHGFAPGACLHLVLGQECDVLAHFAEAFVDNIVVAYHLEGFRAAPAPDVFIAADLHVFDQDATMSALVLREPVYASRSDLLPRLCATRDAEAWLATLDRRFSGRKVP